MKFETSHTKEMEPEPATMYSYVHVQHKTRTWKYGY